MGEGGTRAHCPLGSSWLAGAILALAADAARADVFVVDTAADSAGGTCPAGPLALPGAGSCSLRDAIAAANSSVGDDLILFAPAVFDQAANKVITLASPLPNLTEKVEINATSPPLLTQRVQGIVVRAGTGVGQLLAVTAGAPQLDDLGLEGGGLAIDAGRLAFLQTVDATFAGAITGAGALEKLGAARLVLTGTNTYGETLVEEGTLQGDTLSIPGHDVNDDALLVFDQEASDPPDFLGAIRGTGRLQKVGAGTLFLRAPNSYGGGTTVSAGTLAGFAGNAMSGGSLQGDIQDDAVLVFEQALGADGTFSGSIRGSGRVEKTGPGFLVLTGSNTYAGGTTVSAGLLQGAAAAIPGDVAIASGAQLRFDQAGSGTSSGRITGGGGLPADQVSVEKSGAGTLTLTGVNSYAGGTLVSGGTLRGNTQSLQGEIRLAALTTLVFDQSFAGAYTDLLLGPGALRKEGSGTLVLTRDLGSGLPPFAGPTTIAGGRLEVGRPGDGTAAFLPGAVTVEAGGALGGIGSVGGLATANAGGAISPGNSIGTLTVADAIFRSGSFLEVEVNPTLPADQLVVTGTATIDGGAQVRVIPGAGDYSTPLVAVILAAGTKTGLFDPIPAGTFAFLDATLDQSGNQVALTVVSNGMTLPDFATTPNQRAVATALEQAEAGGDPDVAAVFAEFNTLGAAAVPDALDAMTGEQLTEFATARLAVGQRFLAGIEERISRSAGGEGEPLFAGRGPGSPALAGSPWLLAPFAPAGLGGGASLAAALAMQSGPLGAAPQAEPSALGAWLDGYGIFGHVSGTSGSDDFDTTVWGVSAGFDFRPAPGWIAGLAGGYAASRLDFDSLEGRPEVDTAQGAAYLGYASPRLEAGAAFRYAWNHMTADRDIAFAAPSTLSRTADSDFDGSDLGGRLGAAVHLVDVAGVAVQPFGSLTYTHLQQDAFDESGAGSLDLSADEEEIDSLVSRLGARLHAVVQLDDATWLRPELRAAWLHEFGDRERKLEARIGGVPGATMTVRGAEVARDAAEIGLGWTVGASDRLRFFAGYDLAVNSDLLQHSAGLGLEVLW